MKKLAVLAILSASAGILPAQQQEVVVRHAPYVVSSVSSKTDRGQTTCSTCSTKIRYDRTYRWDVYNHVWIETTDKDKIPKFCKKCGRLEKEQEMLNREEQALDNKIEYENTKSRINVKKRKLARLRRANR